MFMLCYIGLMNIFWYHKHTIYLMGRKAALSVMSGVLEGFLHYTFQLAVDQL